MLFCFPPFNNFYLEKRTNIFKPKFIFTLLLLFRCQCGWEKTDHELGSEDNKQKPWTPNDVTLAETNAYAEITFCGVGKTTKAKVTMNLRGILSQKALLSMYSKIGTDKQENPELFPCAGSFFFSFFFLLNDFFFEIHHS